MIKARLPTNHLVRKVRLVDNNCVHPRRCEHQVIVTMLAPPEKCSFSSDSDRFERVYAGIESLDQRPQPRRQEMGAYTPTDTSASTLALGRPT